MIVFDLDDTLYPERQFVESGFRAVEAHLYAQSYPRLPYAKTFLNVFNASGSGRVFNKGLALLGVEADVSPLVQIYREHTPSITPFTDMPQLVALCGRPGLITDGSNTIQRRKLKTLGLEEAFSVIVCTDALAPNRACWKPSPKPFAHLEKETGLTGHQLTYIGDNPQKDFQGALERGWTCVRLRIKYQLHEAVETPAPVLEAGSIAELSGTLRQLLPQETNSRAGDV